MYETGIQDDKLALIYEGNSKNKVAIQTPGTGLTNRMPIERIVMQGGVLGAPMCAVSIDRIGKESLKNQEHVYLYKGEVEIPLLGMIDDGLMITECGINSIEGNAYLNARIEMIKLRMNEGKSHKIHVGTASKYCPKLLVHEEEMGVSVAEKYLGDIICKDGSNTKNIKSRTAKAMGTISDIKNILKVLRLGSYEFEMAMILRESMFLSALLLNAETWQNLTKENIEDLEIIDRTLIKRILEVPDSTPSASLYLGFGIVPIKYLI